MRRPYLHLFAAISWFIISVILLTLPGTAFPQEDWLDKIWFDKWVHIGMFGVMVILWCLAIRSLIKNSDGVRLRRLFFIVALCALGYGILMEFLQAGFIPFRSFDIGDIVADAVGSAAGLIFSTMRYIKK